SLQQHRPYARRDMRCVGHTNCAVPLHSRGALGVRSWAVWWAALVAMRQLLSHLNLVSISAKNALERRTKAGSVSLISSPILSFTTDFSGLYLIVLLFVLSGHITPWFCRSEVQIIRNSFSGLPSFPSSVLLR